MQATYQIMDQLWMLQTLKTLPGQGGGASAPERGGFERLLQEKYQESGGKDGKEPVGKDTAGQCPETPQTPPSPAPDEQSTQEQMALAAALMALQQPVYADGAPQVPAEPENPVAEVQTPVLSVRTPAQTSPLEQPQTQQYAAPQETPQPPVTAPQTPVISESGSQDAQPQTQPELTSRQQDKTTAGGSENLDAAAALGETPLFERVETIPVKVAQAPREPLELEMPDAAEQLADRVKGALEQGTSKIQLQLSPEHLGTLTVEITRAGDGSLSVLLSAAAPKAAAVLEQHSAGLQTLLMNSTQAPVRVEVHGGQESQQQFLNPDGNGGHNSHNQEQHQESRHPRNDQDFIQRLRLGLIELDRAED